MKALSFGAALALLTLTEIGRADPLETLTWRNPLPTGDNLSCVAYGNGRFVAVGWTTAAALSMVTASLWWRATMEPSRRPPTG